MTRSVILALAVFLTLPDGAGAADFVAGSSPISAESSTHVLVSGGASVIDGRTLWFPADRRLIRLADIDSCELVQWSFDPKGAPKTAPSLVPVPCGALAKAWLKRTIGNRAVRCDVIANGYLLETDAVCKAGGRDLALEMLRVGWAKLSTPVLRNEMYVQAQHSAIAARHGMWSTYVLDMQEWRQEAIDKTLGRKPQADINLLSKRRSEISPPFFDARCQPMRRDQ